MLSRVTRPWRYSGVSNMADGTYAAFNTIANNWMHDIGTYGKQVSCYFQAVSGRNSILDNVW